MGIVGPWTCALHVTHGAAVSRRGAVHHIQPQGAGGPDVPENRITICETGHANLHDLMWKLVNDQPLGKTNRKELVFAKQGVAAWEAAGRPGSIRAFLA